MEREIDRPIGSAAALMVVVSVCRGEERAELKGEALDLPVNLRSYPHLRSGSLGHDRTNKILEWPK